MRPEGKRPIRYIARSGEFLPPHLPTRVEQILPPSPPDEVNQSRISEAREIVAFHLARFGIRRRKK